MVDYEVAGRLLIQVVYAPPPPAAPVMVSLTVAPGATVWEAIKKSGIAEQIPGFDITGCKVGVWGKIQPMETVVPAGGRIEIYRPLIADPKEARRRRVVAKRG